MALLEQRRDRAMKTKRRIYAVLPLLIGACILIDSGCGERGVPPPAAAPAPPAPAGRTITWEGLDTQYKGVTELGTDGKARQR
jgi:hypothetical protein